MPAKITRVVSNIATSKAYINHETRVGVSSVLMKKYIPGLPVRGRTTAFYLRPLQLSGNEPWRKGGLVFTPGRWLIKTGRVVQGICHVRKRDLMENERINLYG